MQSDIIICDLDYFNLMYSLVYCVFDLFFVVLFVLMMQCECFRDFLCSPANICLYLCVSIPVVSAYILN